MSTATSTPVAASATVSEEVPEWVADTADQAKAVGIGVVRGVQNPSLARSAAEARARADLARRLRERGLLGPDAPLVGSVITEVRVDPKTGAVFARAELAPSE